MERDGAPVTVPTLPVHDIFLSCRKPPDDWQLCWLFVRLPEEQPASMMPAAAMAATVRTFEMFTSISFL
jgi:hypothetical protein